MSNVRQILVLFLSFLLSFSIAQAGINSKFSKSTDVIEESCFEEEEEEETVHTSEVTNECNYSLDGGGFDVVFIAEYIDWPLFFFNYDKVNGFPEFNTCSWHVKLFVKYCCLKLDF